LGVTSLLLVGLVLTSAGIMGKGLDGCGGYTSE
jgi:hypothetical protein